MSSFIGKSKKLKDMSSQKYPVLDYTAGVESVQNRAIRFFLFLHKYAPKLAIVWGHMMGTMWGALEDMYSSVMESVT